MLLRGFFEQWNINRDYFHCTFVQFCIYLKSPLHQFCLNFVYQVKIMFGPQISPQCNVSYDLLFEKIIYFMFLDM